MDMSPDWVFWNRHELDDMEDWVDAQHRRWELQVISMQSNWLNHHKGAKEMMQ